MTNRAINKAIAEYLSWKELDFHLDGKRILGKRPSFHNGKIVSYTVDQYVPDYCGDLNEIHEVVEMLKGDDDIKYVNYLFASVGINRYYYMGATPEAFPADRQMKVINASALKRAEAFLRTIDKWKE
jgi:hypothetical protein